MKSKLKIKLLKLLPIDDLKGYLPAMNQKRMVMELLTNDRSKVGNMTLIAILIGTVKMLMQENPDWEEYIDTDRDENEEEVPEPCGDPECKGCAELEKAIAFAKENGGTIKAVRLTKKEAMEMGIIDENGNDIKKGVGHCKDDDGSPDKVIH